MAFGKIITISGVPGVGKSYIKDYLLKNIKNAEPAINVTTRLKNSDKETTSYVEHVTSEDFQKKIMAGELCGVRVYNGEWCGFKTEQIEKIDDGVNLIAEVSYDSLEEVKDELVNVISIYVLPKNIDRAKKELQERYPNPDVLREKLQEIEEEMKWFGVRVNKVIDITIRNDYTEQTCEDLMKRINQIIYRKEKNETDRDD